MKRAQHGKPETSETKKLQKRVVNRRRRQAERRDPESAPVKNAYKNYTN
jgi:hypothetical protein